MANKSVKAFEKDTVEQRLDSLQRFLSAVVEHPVLSKSPVLGAFLTEEKLDSVRDQFDSQYLQMKHGFLSTNFSMDAIENFDIKDLLTETGTLKSSIGLKYHKFSIETEEMLKTSEGVYSRLKPLCLELSDSMGRSAEILQRITAELNIAIEANSKFNKNVHQGQWADLGLVLKDFSSSFEQWAHQMSNNALLSKEQLYKTFKYARKEYEASIKVIEMRNAAGQGYFSAIRSLNEIKDRMLAGDPSKWDLDFTAAKIAPEELKKNPVVAKHLLMPGKRELVHKMRLAFGYFNELMVKEISDLGRNQAVKFARALGNFSAERGEVIDVERKSLDSLQEKLRHAIPVLLSGQSVVETPSS